MLAKAQKIKSELVQLRRAIHQFPELGFDVNGTADLVAHTRLKTPTAVAEWLIGRAMQFESRLLQLAQQLQLIIYPRFY